MTITLTKKMPRANGQAIPRAGAPGAEDWDGQKVNDTHRALAVPSTLPEAQPSALSTGRPPRALLAAGQAALETQTQHAGGTTSGGGHSPSDTQKGAAPAGYLSLRIFAEMLEDAMQARIACSNRIERAGVDDTPYLAQLAAMEAAEHSVSLALGRCYRQVVDQDIILWQSDAKGIGEHLLARLLGVIGHPRHTNVYYWEGDGKNRVLVDDGPYERRVSDLWSYCGHGDVTRRRKTGMTAEEAAATGNPRAKMLVHLLAESCMKCMASPYRRVYDQRRALTQDRVHAAPCVRCGPSGHPAEVGSPWSAAHQHADALRIVGKALLKDLWLVS